MDEYDLKESAKFLGELYPVLLDKNGHAISDGEHRRRAKVKWHTVRLKQIDSKEKLLAARIAANCARRQVPFGESEKWVNELAERLQNDGHLSRTIAKMTGMQDQWVRERLSEKYKALHNARTNQKIAMDTPRFRERKSQKDGVLFAPPPGIAERKDKGDWILQWWEKLFDTFPEPSAVSDLDERQKQVLRKALPKLRQQLETWEKALGKEVLDVEVI